MRQHVPEIISSSIKKVRRASAAAMLLAGLGMSACGVPEHVTEQPPVKPIREHEKDFDPSKYRRNAGGGSTTEQPVMEERRSEEPIWIERTEKVMGFRVQLYSTTNVDEAQKTLANLRSRIDSLQIDPGRLDMIFDAPYYKIRAGDFLIRTAADELRESLRAAGMNEAWVVRDNVLKVVREEKKD